MAYGNRSYNNNRGGYKKSYNNNRGGGGNRSNNNNREMLPLHFFTGLYEAEGKVFARASFDIDRLREALDNAEADTKREGKVQIIVMPAERGADFWVALSGLSPMEEDKPEKKEYRKSTPVQRAASKTASRKQEPEPEEDEKQDDGGTDTWDD